MAAKRVCVAEGMDLSETLVSTFLFKKKKKILHKCIAIFIYYLYIYFWLH